MRTKAVIVLGDAQLVCWVRSGRVLVRLRTHDSMWAFLTSLRLGDNEHTALSRSKDRNSKCCGFVSIVFCFCVNFYHKRLVLQMNGCLN